METLTAPRIGLDPDQRRVVEHDAGPLLVLGGPGTGKSTVLVERWLQLGGSGGEPPIHGAARFHDDSGGPPERMGGSGTAPHRVLLLVPTRERAIALRDELPWLLPQRAIIDVPVHTWHAFAYHLVTRYYPLLGYDRPPVRLTSPEQWSVVRELLHTEDSPAWGEYAENITTDAFVGEVADFCVRAGHRGLGEGELEDLAASRPAHAPVARFAVRYRKHLETTAALDYPGLILAATRLLDTNDDVRDAVHRRFPHVLVDDGQELAPAQVALLARLDTSNLVCAADPDSAIESFRGSDPRWLERFDGVAPGHATAVLGTCRRHGETIGRVGSSLIAHSANGAHRPVAFEGPGEGIAGLRCYSTLSQEIEAAAREVRAAHLTQGVPYERMAILLAQPSTYQHALCRMLESLGVPYRADAADRPLGAEPAVSAILDLCRVAYDEAPAPDLLRRVLTSPMVGMHPHRFRELERDAGMRQGTSLVAVIDADGSPEAAEYRKLRDIAIAHADETADATLARLFDASAWCGDLRSRRRTEPEAAHQVESLAALAKALGHFVERWSGGTMRIYLETSAPGGFPPERWTPSWRSSGVHVLSLHSSKGMEWDLVCVLGLAEGQIPKAHRAQGLFDPWALEAGSAVDRALAQLAEERRTLYVALTRARLTLVASTSPGTKRATPSRFLEESFGEIPEPILPGDAGPPLTLNEAASRLRRTIGDPQAAEHEKAAAAAALARVGGVAPSSWWWRRTWTPGTPLYPEGKLVTSYSRIGRYKDCPLRYVLESVLGLDPESTYQMKFGSLIHRLIERAEKGEITSREEMGNAYRDEFTVHHRDDYPNTVFARTYYRFGVQCLNRWWELERPRFETVAVEYAFNDLDIDGHTIRGRIDRVARGPKGLVLTDYKTSRSPAPVEDTRESLQLAIYYRAATTYEDLQRHGEPVCMQLVYPGVEHTSRIDGSRECAKRFQKPEEAEAALVTLVDYLRSAAEERFAPDPQADCQWCKMKPLCPRWPEGREVGP